MTWQSSTAYGLETRRPVDWRHRAACRDEDSELFFPIGEAGPALIQTEQAKAVCRRCHVVDECLAWAIDNRVSDGVWGGMTPEERRREKASRAERDRRARARAVEAVPKPAPAVQPCGTVAAYERHRRRGEATCGACRQAMAVYCARRKERRQQRAAA